MLRKLSVAFAAGAVVAVAVFGLTSSNLPVTDGTTMGFMGAGLGLFSLGAALLFFARRRGTTE